MGEIEKLTEVKSAIEEYKKKNPVQAAEEEKRKISADDPRLPFSSPMQASQAKFDFKNQTSPH